MQQIIDFVKNFIFLLKGGFVSMWYHISKKYLGKRKKLTPKVCDYNSTNIYEEGDIPHICVSDSLLNCLCAIIGNCKPDTNSFLRHFSENPCVHQKFTTYHSDFSLEFIDK